MKNKLKILLGGIIAKIPGQGGLTWVVLQYLLGLQRLGHEVHFLEIVTSSDLKPANVPLSESNNASYLAGVEKQFGLQGAVSLFNTSTGETVGKSQKELLKYSSECDLLLNLSGLLNEARFYERIPIRAYIDLDPAFTQLWICEQGADVGMGGHNRFVTIGMNLGAPECVIPTLDKFWIRTLPPLVLANWALAKERPTLGFTTVANWRGYGSINRDGVFYGQKAHSLRPFFEAPILTNALFELALSIHPDEKSDLQQLAKFGWRLLDPSRIAATPIRFQQFIQQSRAEFGIAKSGYVASNCGWFSDRSICYLASGRPVIAQETGFSAHLPTGVGLLAFESMGDLLDRIDQVDSNYEAQRKAAREIAETFFDSDRVLTRLLNKLGMAV